MTQSTDRLDRIEALLATVAESNAASTQRLDRIEVGLDRTEKIVESNARAIEAWSSRIEDGMAEAEEISSAMAANTNRRMEEAITDTVRMMANLGQQQQETDQRFNNLLEEARADRQEARADRQRIDEALAKADRDRALNESEHRAFRETFQTLLAEIARLWQRVAG
jgi:chromosome segregation ATPase